MQHNLSDTTSGRFFAFQLKNTSGNQNCRYSFVEGTLPILEIFLTF